MSLKYSKIPDKHEVFVTIMKIFDFRLFRVVVILKIKTNIACFSNFVLPTKEFSICHKLECSNPYRLKLRFNWIDKKIRACGKNGIKFWILPPVQKVEMRYIIKY